MPLPKPVLRKDGQRLQEINIWIHQATVIVRTKGQKYCKAYAYFDFTSYCFGDVEMKKRLRNVWEANCTWEQAAAASKEKPFGIRQDRNFSI